ncbi:MAG: hypothetical protein KGH98_03460 [Candidatus Micrarchaeota archaeon]|nr:hypothetical protein [Candidatus Micrarchaeota archaeon]
MAKTAVAPAPTKFNDERVEKAVTEFARLWDKLYIKDYSVGGLSYANKNGSLRRKTNIINSLVGQFEDEMDYKSAYYVTKHALSMLTLTLDQVRSKQAYESASNKRRAEVVKDITDAIMDINLSHLLRKKRGRKETGLGMP